MPTGCGAWQGLLGGLSNVVECLRGEGAPPPAVRAVVHAALHYVDAELLNALVLRRDCCSISAIKALQVWSAYTLYQTLAWFQPVLPLTQTPYFKTSVMVLAIVEGTVVM